MNAAGKTAEVLVFSGNANQKLAGSIAEHLGTQLGKVKISRFADGEVNLQIMESLRGKDVYIVALARQTRAFRCTAPRRRDNLELFKVCCNRSWGNIVLHTLQTF